jgi:dynein heavy chain
VCFVCRADEAHDVLTESKLERVFLYCLIWSLGGLLDIKERLALDAELRSFAGPNMPPK